MGPHTTGDSEQKIMRRMRGHADHGGKIVFSVRKEIFLSVVCCGDFLNSLMPFDCTTLASKRIEGPRIDFRLESHHELRPFVMSDFRVALRLEQTIDH